jgi:hypothetical protein
MITMVIFRMEGERSGKAKKLKKEVETNKQIKKTKENKQKFQRGNPALFAMCLFCCYWLLFSFSFSLGMGQSVQGAMLIWSRVVCESTTCHLAHLMVCIFPSGPGTGIWQQHGSPPGFSI